MTSFEELDELLRRVTDAGPRAEGFTTREGWDRIRTMLSSWRTVYQPMTEVNRWAHGIPIILDATLPPDVIEFRAPDGTLLERITLDPPREAS